MTNDKGMLLLCWYVSRDISRRSLLYRFSPYILPICA